MRKIMLVLAAMAMMVLLSLTAMAAENDNPYCQIKLTDQEARELELILAMEAQDEPYEGQRAVVEVIFDRVLSEDYPDTVHGVLSQKGQFATWKYIDRPYNTPTEEQCDAIAETMARGPEILPSTRYVFFCTSKRGWMHDCVKIGHHYFGK